MADESAKTVPPVPYKVPVITPQGFINDVWGKWFKQVFQRIGGNIAPTNNELANTQGDDIQNLQNQIDAANGSIASLASTVAGHSTQISNLQSSLNDILQGPVL